MCVIEFEFNVEEPAVVPTDCVQSHVDFGFKVSVYFESGGLHVDRANGRMM